MSLDDSLAPSLTRVALVSWLLSLSCCCSGQEECNKKKNSFNKKTSAGQTCVKQTFSFGSNLIFILVLWINSCIRRGREDLHPRLPLLLLSLILNPIPYSLLLLCFGRDRMLEAREESSTDSFTASNIKYSLESIFSLPAFISTCLWLLYKKARDTCSFSYSYLASWRHHHHRNFFLWFSLNFNFLWGKREREKETLRSWLISSQDSFPSLFFFVRESKR